MNMSLLRRLSFLFALLCVAGVASFAGAAVPAAPAAAEPANGTADAGDKTDSSDDSDWERRFSRRGRLEWHRHRGGGHEGDLVSIGHDSHLPDGQKADGVVSIFGSSSSEGEAQDVVSIFGNTRVSGPVSDDAVAVLGSTYVDAKVDGDVVAVLGNIELGPNAEVGGEVVSVFGIVKRDPSAVVHGATQRVLSFDLGGVTGVGWLNSWIHHCLLYGRPLAFAPDLGWAWILALAFLAFYACLALLFRTGIEECVRTLDSQPGQTALAALLAMLLTPVLIVLLCVTLIGIAAVPFVVAALFCVALFGKTVMLAWLGGRITGGRAGPGVHPAVAVLVGGAVALVLYVIPVFGFLVYKLLGFFGFGAVVYTLILKTRARRAAQSPAAAAGGATFISGGTPGSTIPPAYAAAAAAAAGSAAVGAAASGAPAGSAASAYAHITAAMPRAGFWIRMAALFLDTLLIAVLMSLVHPFGHLHLVILAIYGAVMWKLRGTTVGGIVFDLHVVRLDGRPLDWETAIVRALGCFLSLFAVFLGFIWIAFDDNHQAWHDKIAGTVVVRVNKTAMPA